MAFSFTVPFTRVAVGGLSPLFIGSGRAVIAAVLGAMVLALTRQRIPRPMQWARLAVVAAGVVVGFPLLSSFALTSVPASHGAVVIALLPAATAVMAVLRGKERPPRSFWVMAVAGAAVTVVFASVHGGGFAALAWEDLLLFGAVVAAAIGYAEGALLARELGSWQMVSWALVLSSPLMFVLTIVSAVQQSPAASVTEWAAFAYLAVISMFLGFFAWYRGLAIGPIAQVSQVQLVQPVLSILWAALLLREDVGWATVLGGLAVVLCAGIAVRTRLGRPFRTIKFRILPTHYAVPAVAEGVEIREPAHYYPGMSERANDGGTDRREEDLEPGEVLGSLQSVAQRISSAAGLSGVKVAVAESLTGGSIATHLSAAHESSEWFAGAVVAYQPSVKFDVLGVLPGPVVTAECAEQMARGVATLLGADVAVSVTGVGGPGPEEGHPMGTVYVGVAGHHGSRSRLFHFEGGPSVVVERSTEAALSLLADELSMHRVPAD